MKNVFAVLEKLSESLKEKSQRSRTKAATLAYIDAANMLEDEIASIVANIETIQKEKLAQQMKKFDTSHNDYQTILERGHIGIPNEVHENLSMYSIGDKTANEVFNDTPEEFKEGILDRVVSDKEMIEQLAAYRHNFHYITHTKGHDGIDENNKVYEVKNRKYKYSKTKRFDPCIIFDRLSPANLRKLKEGRPDIIFNITDGAKLLVELRIAFSDKIVKLYEDKVKQLENSKTSGAQIPFTEYKDDIVAVTYVSDDIQDYNIQKQFLKYIEENA